MCIWLYLLLKKYCRVEFLIGFLLQLLKANDFDRDGCRKFIVQFPWWKMKTFLFARVIAEKLLLARPWGGEYCISFPTQAVLRRSLNLSWTIFLTGFNACIDNLSYLLQSLDKQLLLCNFYISALTSSLLQIQQHKQYFLLALIPAQAIFPTCFNPKIGNLRYLCNFSSFSVYSSED